MWYVYTYVCTHVYIGCYLASLCYIPYNFHSLLIFVIHHRFVIFEVFSPVLKEFFMMVIYSAGTNVKDSNIRLLSIFSKNVFFYQTFVTVVIIIKM